MKVSCSCTENISSIISSHNKKLIKNHAPNTKPCNCRTKSTCPLNGQCKSQDKIYKCTVSTSVNPEKVYLRTAEADFKKPYYNHPKSFRKSDIIMAQVFPSIYGKSRKNTMKSVFEMVNSQKGSCIFQHNKKVSLCLHETLEMVNYSHPEQLLNKHCF